MKKLLKKRIIIPFCALVIFISSTAFQNDFFEIAKQIEIFTTLYKEVNMNYVDDTNPAQLMDTAIKSMLSDLDPYTQFYNEQDVEAEKIRRTGDYTGIGANVRTMKDKLVIIEPYKDYPADKAGLKAGDEIIKIGNTVLANYKEDAGDLLKGSSSTKVTVTYLRQGKEYNADIMRSEVEIDAVPHFSMIDDKTGYIVLDKFNNKASSQTGYAVKDLKAQGAENIILDLRGNPGGLLLEAVKIVNLFVPKGQLVVSTKSKVKKFNRSYYTQNDPIDTEIPLIVLINGTSASASEIVSGALQDLDRAVIIGSRSFGKGLVQRPKPLTYGTQLKITISRYYTPSGRCIQALDYWNRDDKGNAVRIEKDKYNEFKTKNGRKVFDGGGVFPDEALAETKNSAITKAIQNDFLIFDFATDYYYKHPNTDIHNFKLTTADFNDFKNFLKTNDFTFVTETEKALSKVLEKAVKEDLDDNIETDYNALVSKLNNSKELAINENKEEILALLTDEIVKRFVYREGLYEFYREHNLEIKKASEILSSPSTYKNYLN
ncbi:S41 family peptidase [Hanstruepera ponticola]|uniref:S41 family peptidase n=1 Tax=Hanstruepera ponticola TaxID=2042995 RepID=UPI000CF18881|nr:S41 family peptidase [Hanstruepera ponticola]